MLCADGIAFARSSLAIMLSAHGRASNIYVPWECGPGTYAREVRTKQSPKIVQDNTTLLAIEKPNAEVTYPFSSEGRTSSSFGVFVTCQKINVIWQNQRELCAAVLIEHIGLFL